MERATMAVKVVCPNPDCGASYRVAEDVLGRRGRCRKCGRAFRLLAPTLVPGPGVPAPVPVADWRPPALALAYAHARGVIHRDLKPANVMVCGDGTPIVMDFGLARRESDERMTVSGAALGTPAYMPPEQVRGEVRDIGPRSDVYSLG